MKIEELKERIKEVIGQDIILKYNIDNGSNAILKHYSNIQFALTEDGALRIDGYLPKTKKLNWELWLFSIIVQQLPGCCAYLLCHSTSINHSYRGKGIGTLLQEFKIYLAKENKYTAMMCTVLDENVAQTKLMQKFGWDIVNDSKLKNKKTGNDVSMYIKHL